MPGKMITMRYYSLILTLLALFAVSFSQYFVQGEESERPEIPEAKQMVLEILVPTKQLTNTDVLKSMMSVPRAQFVAKDLRPFAYQDFALPIGEKQTISPPFVVAYMTETLEPKKTDRVLEIGTGSGYQAAVLSSLVADVYTIEIVRPLGKKAEALLKKLNYDNVHCKVGDGYKGWPEAAPFDKIIVTCSPEAIPQPLIDQLRDGGKILIPLGDRYHQYFYLCTKKGTEMTKEMLMPAFFVPMTGEAESLRKVQPDPKNPAIVGGDFEQVNERDSTPAGWYYTRNVVVRPDLEAPQGKNVLVIDNSQVAQEHQTKDEQTPRRKESRNRTTSDKQDRPNDDQITVHYSEKESRRANQRQQELTAHLMQPFPIDGQTVRKIDITCSLRGSNLKPNGNRKTIPVLTLTFFDADRDTLGEKVIIAVPNGSFEWKKIERLDIAIPRKAKEGSIRLGILDGIGVLEVDQLTLEKSPARRK